MDSSCLFGCSAESVGADPHLLTIVKIRRWTGHLTGIVATGVAATRIATGARIADADRFIVCTARGQRDEYDRGSNRRDDTRCRAVPHEKNLDLDQLRSEGYRNHAGTRGHAG